MACFSGIPKVVETFFAILSATAFFITYEHLIDVK